MKLPSALVISALVLAGLHVACSQGAGTPNKPPAAVDRDSCTVAEDCVLVEACCGCSAGGRRVAIRKDAVADYDATRKQRCADSACTTVMSQHPSCDAEAGCEEGHCKVLPHMGGLP